MLLQLGRVEEQCKVVNSLNEFAYISLSLVLLIFIRTLSNKETMCSANVLAPLKIDCEDLWSRLRTILAHNLVPWASSTATLI
jgi:hypothetical protein